MEKPANDHARYQFLVSIGESLHENVNTKAVSGTNLQVAERAVRLADRCLGALVIVFTLIVHIGLFMEQTGNLALILSFAFGCLPGVLLFSPRVSHMIAVAFLGLPCAQMAYWMCDISNSPTSPILHVGHGLICLLVPYGILRAIWIPLAAQSATVNPKSPEFDGSG